MDAQGLALFLGCLLPISICIYTDCTKHILPNWLTVAIALSGLTAAVLLGRAPDALIGAILAGGILIIAGLFGGIGGGDVKLAFGIGMWFGWYGGAAVILVGCLLAILWSIPKSLKNGIRNVSVPLGAFMGFAAWGCVLVNIL